MKNVPVFISLYTIYSRRKGRNVEIMNTTRMVIVFLISTFLLPFLHFAKLLATGNLPLREGGKIFQGNGPGRK